MKEHKILVKNDLGNLLESIKCNSKEGNKKSCLMLPDEDRFYNMRDGIRRSVNTGAVTEWLVNNTDAFVFNEDFYLYDNGYYRRFEDYELQGNIQDILDVKIRKVKDFSSIAYALKCHTKLQKSEEEINSLSHIINLQNGYYDLNSQTFYEGHSPDILSTNRIEASFIKNYTANQHKTWTEYLDYTLRETELQYVLQEVLGYCLTTSNAAKKFFLFNGVSNSGKSKIIELLTALVGQKNVSNVPLQDLNGFKIVEVYQKILNVYADLSNKSMNNDNIIKVLTGEDRVFADRKYKSPITFYNTAKMLFSANNLPKVNGDNSEAFFNRVMIIPFRHAKPVEQQDHKLLEKFLSEKDAIFMWMLEGILRLHNNGYKFSHSEIIENEVGNYKHVNSVFANFVENNCDIGEEYRVSSELLYEHFRSFCLADGREAQNIPSKKHMFEFLVSNYGCTYGIKRINGVRAVEGIKLK